MKQYCVLLLLVWTGVDCTYPNVALRGKATQSTTNPGGLSNANNAINGNNDTHVDDGSCAQTTAQDGPWWRVDLLEKYIVTSITVTGAEPGIEKLYGASIRVGDTKGEDNPVVAHIIPDAGVTQTFKFDDKAVQGRYVSVDLKGQSHNLQLCEVEVHGYHAETVNNLATFGKASQSSVANNALAYYAIDGNRDTIRSCMKTDEELNPWLRLDLGKTRKVFSVKVTNSLADAADVNGAEIRIGDSADNNGNNNPVCTTITSIIAGQTETFDCKGMEGQYVNIVISGQTRSLHVCEVEVYGSVLN